MCENNASRSKPPSVARARSLLPLSLAFIKGGSIECNPSVACITQTHPQNLLTSHDRYTPQGGRRPSSGGMSTSDAATAAAHSLANERCQVCSDDPQENIFRPLPEPYHEPLPAGWQVVRHSNGYPCFVHLQSKVCMWSLPYVMPEDAHVDDHTVPGVVRRTLHSMPNTLATGEASKRPRPNTLPPLQQQQQQRPPPPPPQQQPPPPPPTSATPRRPATLPSTLLAELGPNGQKRAIHPGCPAFDIDITGKTPVSILNEFCPKVLKCPPEFVVTTQEDPVNPYLTTIVCEGVVVAKAGFSSKRISRQLAARKALAIFAPLLDIGSEDFDETVNAVDTGGGVLGAAGATNEVLEAKEVETLRLPLNDDRILVCAPPAAQNGTDGLAAYPVPPPSLLSLLSLSLCMCVCDGRRLDLVCPPGQHHRQDAGYGPAGALPQACRQAADLLVRRRPRVGQPLAADVPCHRRAVHGRERLSG